MPAGAPQGAAEFVSIHIGQLPVDNDREDMLMV
jgi:hypothetical protein